MTRIHGGGISRGARRTFQGTEILTRLEGGEAKLRGALDELRDARDGATSADAAHKDVKGPVRVAPDLGARGLSVHLCPCAGPPPETTVSGDLSSPGGPRQL